MNIGLKNCAEVMKFFWINHKKVITSRQKCVLRINSLNCLHRVNKCQYKISILVLKNIFHTLEDKGVISNDKIKWSQISAKIEALYKENGAKLCIESGCHCITNKKPEEKSYLLSMYNQVTSIEKYFTTYITSILSKEDNLYQEALGKIMTFNQYRVHQRNQLQPREAL